MKLKQFVSWCILRAKRVHGAQQMLKKNLVMKLKNILSWKLEGYTGSCGTDNSKNTSWKDDAWAMSEKDEQVIQNKIGWKDTLGKGKNMSKT